ncbi:MAG: adenylyltransferase/cytidyltransferase family protein [Candidatus Staskawiczbacteria bacterium]|nr:adenylyltransferase/cytidyltransferase family protein [Candidatus Staskawiczbacteria bacterium]
MKKIVITSGYYNPLHIGHIDLIREAKKLGCFSLWRNPLDFFIKKE